MLAAATTQVIRSYLLSAAEEMRRTLVRTAFNPVIYEVFDFGISLYDRNLARKLRARRHRAHELSVLELGARDGCHALRACVRPKR
jgi:N-methylhydantoinase B/oxoprolinase/acetone carboxylase alpha subunit